MGAPSAALVGSACAAGIVVLRLSPTARAWLFAFIWKHAGTSLADGMMRERKEALVRRARLEGRVLDVGSGTGTQLKYVCGAAAPRVRELVCVEPNPFFHARLRAAIRVAEDDAARAGVRVSISLFEGTLAQYAAATGGAAAGSFDAITCLHGIIGLHTDSSMLCAIEATHLETRSLSIGSRANHVHLQATAREVASRF